MTSRKKRARPSPSHGSWNPPALAQQSPVKGATAKHTGKRSLMLQDSPGPPSKKVKISKEANAKIAPHCQVKPVPVAVPSVQPLQQDAHTRPDTSAESEHAKFLEQHPMAWSEEDEAQAQLLVKLHLTRCDNRRLKAELHDLRTRWRQNELKIKQDHMLNVLKEREALRKEMQQSARWRNIGEQARKQAEQATEQCDHLRKHHTEHVDHLTKELYTQKARRRMAEGEMRSYRDEMEHQTDLRRMVEEDLEALRRLENEEISVIKERQKKSELPPAYGSLDMEDMTPKAWEQHGHDSGALEITRVKYLMRNRFTKEVEAAQAQHDAAVTSAYRHVAPPQASESVLVLRYSMALADAAEICTDVLAQADSVQQWSYTVMFDERAKESSTGMDASLPLHQRDDFKSMVKRMHARANFIADRLAKIMVDLTYRIVAAMEARPFEVMLGDDQRAKIALCWNRVDRTFLDCLNRLFNMPVDKHIGGTKGESLPSARERLMAMSHYHTHLSMLAPKLMALFVEPPDVFQDGTAERGLSTFFEDSLSWLEEQVETERKQAAMERDERCRAAREAEDQARERERVREREERESRGARAAARMREAEEIEERRRANWRERLEGTSSEVQLGQAGQNVLRLEAIQALQMVQHEVQNAPGQQGQPRGASRARSSRPRDSAPAASIARQVGRSERRQHGPGQRSPHQPQRPDSVAEDNRQQQQSELQNASPRTAPQHSAALAETTAINDAEMTRWGRTRLRERAAEDAEARRTAEEWRAGFRRDTERHRRPWLLPGRGGSVVSSMPSAARSEAGSD